MNGFSTTSNLPAIESEYLRILILSQSYNATYNFLFSVYFFSDISAVITLTYLLFNSSTVPAIVVLIVLLAVTCTICNLNFAISQATEAHLLSTKLITACRDSCQGGLDGEKEFWVGMRPLIVEAGGLCKFETKKFLLFIWGQIVISRLAELLIAF